MGIVASIRWPSFLLTPFLKWFVSHYDVNMEESSRPLEDFTTIQDFFTRTLKENARSIDSAKKSFVSPVDGRVLSFGKIENNTIIQAKGEGSTLDELVDIPGYRHRFSGGDFLVIYLSPRDYHRIHSPLTGKINGYSYIPGNLFPVNTFAVQNIPRLFARNERLITYIEADHKLCGLVKVGALNVGSIKVNYQPHIQTNPARPFIRSEVFMSSMDIVKGEEFARFEMGSTVVLLFEKGMVKLNSLTEYQQVRLGETIATLL
jgi:phosphatidylserine decarboxylase